MYTLETSTADLPTQHPLDPHVEPEIDEEFLDDEEYPEEAASSLDQPKPTLHTIYVTLPTGDFTGWGPRITAHGSGFRLN